MAAGERLGPYRLLHRLGEGGMAEVWAAQKDGGDGAPVALKTLPLTETPSQVELMRFLDEGKLCAQLRHPNLVSVLEVGLAGRRAYLEMELLEGLPLSRLAGAPLPPGLVVGVGLQVLRGLEHAQGEPFRVVHRDIKPSNLFLCRDGVVKVIDFGIAATPLLDRTVTRTGTFRGSLAYAAPEQVRGEPLDSRTDLFALGLVLRELLTGERPLGRGSDAEIVGQLLLRPLLPLTELRPQLDPELSDALDWALEKEPSGRPGSAAEWARTLAQVAAPLGIWDEARLARWYEEHAAERGGVVGQTSTRTHPPEPLPLDAASGGTQAGPPPVAERSGSRFAAPGLRWALVAVLLAGVGATVLTVSRPSTAAPAPVPPRPEPPLAAPLEGPRAPPKEDAPSPSEPSGAQPKQGTSSRRTSPATPPAPARVAPTGQGFVTVEARPDWANIFLNGKAAGPSPLFRHPVPAGRVLVEGVRPDGSRRKRVVGVAAQKESIVVLEW